MARLRTLIAIISTAALPLVVAPAALAHTDQVGSSSGVATSNLCLLSFDCTYVNYRHGKPTDTVKHSGTLSDWTLNSGSVGGQVQLRILRPIGNGKFKFVHSSSWRTVSTDGENTFAAHIDVKTGDVLALSNDTSGIYMTGAPAGTCVRYFTSSVANGSTGKPEQIAAALRLLLSADVKR